MVRDYSASNTWAWIAGTAGRFAVEVRVRNAGSASSYDALRDSAFFNIRNTSLPMWQDFDGDGRTDLAVWRPSDGSWYLRTSSTGYDLGSWLIYQWGLPGDIPLAADFDGDGKTDLTV
jgi:hypothetical protein